MPYGVDKKLGGDNEENTKWMEGCVESVMKGGKDKSTAVAICKSQLRKKKESKSDMDGEMMDDDLDEEYESFMADCTTNLLRSGKADTMDEATKMCNDIYQGNSGDTEACHRYIFNLLN